jgi:RNA polymerase sigma-70 factor (ECF subfamily)
LLNDDKDLLSRCLNREVAAEYQLYHRFAPRMYGICLRYGGNQMEAEEILQNGFMRLFSHLHQFRHEGSFEGWVQRIFVNTAINYYKSNLKYNLDVELSDDLGDHTSRDAMSLMSENELLSVIQRLPSGYRTIFNMYVIENYQHNEIATILGIAEGTSKSCLHRAKTIIQRMLKEMEK